MLNRSYYWLILALAIPAFIWLVPTLWMVSLSFQPNDVLARTTSSTALGLIPAPFTAENYTALFAFGQAGFDFAVVIFAVMAIMSFTFGVWVVAGGGSPVTALREPLVWGAVLGLLFMLMGWTVPEWMGNTLDMIGQIAIPLMLVTLGVAISRLQPRSLGRAVWMSALKLAVCVSLPLAVGLWFGLPKLALGVLVLQVATPVAVTSYMLATKYRAGADEVAGLVMVSTLISVVAIPVILAFFI